MKTVAPTWYLQVATGPASSPAIARLRVEAQAASQERLKREAGAFLQDISKSHPVVLFLDDLHWADVSTIDLLNYLASRFADMRVLILTTYRPSDMALAQHPFLEIRNDLRSRGLLEEIWPRGFSARRTSATTSRSSFPEHRLPAGVRRRHPREDRGQSAVHGRPRPLPARLRPHRRTAGTGGWPRAAVGHARATCRNRCAA